MNDEALTLIVNFLSIKRIIAFWVLVKVRGLRRLSPCPGLGPLLRSESIPCWAYRVTVFCFMSGEIIMLIRFIYLFIIPHSDKTEVAIKLSSVKAVDNPSFSQTETIRIARIYETR